MSKTVSMRFQPRTRRGGNARAKSGGVVRRSQAPVGAGAALAATRPPRDDRPARQVFIWGASRVIRGRWILGLVGFMIAGDAPKVVLPSACAAC